MDRAVLTPKELEEREELFKHEMTQLFLSLKDQLSNTDNIKSPLEGLDLTAGDLHKKLDYVPMKAAEVKKITQDVPVTNILTEYTALTDVQPTIAFEGIEDLPPVGISMVFTPIAEINAERVAQSIPDEKITLKYDALQPVKLDSFSVDVPTIGSIEPYTPAALEFPEIKAVDVPVMSKPLEFTPLELHGNVRATFEMPNTASIAVEYSPLQSVELDSFSVDVPTIGSIEPYTPTATELPDIKAIDIPILSKPPEFTPLEEVKVKPIKVDVSVTKSEIIHKKSKVVNNELPKIDVPVLGRIPKYESIKNVSIETSVKSLPKQEISISRMNKTVVEKAKLSPEFVLAAENAAPKDFYSMWINM